MSDEQNPASDDENYPSDQGNEEGRDKEPTNHDADFDRAIKTLTDVMTDAKQQVGHRLEAARSILHYTEPHDKS